MIVSAECGRKICLISLHFSEYIFHLAKAFAENNNVLVVVYEDNALNEIGPHYRELFLGEKIAIHSLKSPRNIFGIISNCIDLSWMVRRFGPDVIHAQEGLRDELAFALPFLPKVPFFLTIHDPDPHSGRDYRKFRFSRHRLYRWILRRRSSAAIVHGEQLKQVVEGAWPKLKGRVYVIPHGPLGIVTDESRESPRISGALLFFGRMGEYKGLGVFIQAVLSLRASGYKVFGIVAGRGPDLELNRSAMDGIEFFDVRDRYIPASEVDQLFRQADIVVLPYKDGTQSGVAAMALGYGLPVVASNVGSIPELVRHGKNGLLVPPGDPSSLASAIAQLLDSDELRAGLAAGARELRDGELSWSKIGRRTSSIFEEYILTPRSDLKLG